MFRGCVWCKLGCIEFVFVFIVVEVGDWLVVELFGYGSLVIFYLFLYVDGVVVVFVECVSLEDGDFVFWFLFFCLICVFGV